MSESEKFAVVVIAVFIFVFVYGAVIIEGIYKVKQAEAFAGSVSAQIEVMK